MHNMVQPPVQCLVFFEGFGVDVAYVGGFYTHNRIVIRDMSRVGHRSCHMLIALLVVYLHGLLAHISSFLLCRRV